MKFKEFKDYCWNTDVSRFEDSFFSFMALNGAIPKEYIGFHLHGWYDEPDDIHQSTIDNEANLDIIRTFNPSLLYAGNQWLKDKLEQQGFPAELYGWFEGGGFAVVLITPIELPKVKVPPFLNGVIKGI